MNESTISAPSGQGPSTFFTDPGKEHVDADVYTDDDATDSSSSASTVLPVNLRWNNVCLSIPKRRRRRCVLEPQRSTTEVLSNVCGSAQSGQLLAILGASGSGKTSLLKILAGRADGKHQIVHGDVHLNESPRNVEEFRYQHAYVDQDDAIFGELTVEEQVSFSARLRLPSKIPSQEKKAIVDQVITELGLDEVRNSQIGGKFVRGISGGERKRVSIATEIVTQPSMIFLDEPTSGLDSFNALSVMKTLRQLATNNRTVVCTLHSPRSAIFSLIDSILLLSEGRVVYHGPAHLCLPYFSNLGFPAPVYYNPADFLIDLTTVDYRSPEAEKSSRARLRYLTGQFSEKHSCTPASSQDSDRKKRFHIKPRLDNNWFVEFFLLIQRGLKLLVRSKVPNLMRLFQVVMFGIFLGGIWFRKGHDRELAARKSIPGILFFITINQSGAAYQVLFSFPLERTVITRERAANMYGTSSYLLAKSLMDFVKSVIFVFLFCAIVYFMVGLRTGIAPFLQFTLAVLMMTFFAESLSFCVSVLTGDAQSSSSLVTVLIVLFLLFGGYFIDIHEMPPWLAIFKWTSCMYYTYNAMMAVEFPLDAADQIATMVRTEAGLNTLTYTENVTILMVMTIVLRVAAYFLLRYLRAPKFLRF